MRKTRIRPPTIYSMLRRLRDIAHLEADSHTNPHASRHGFAIRKLEQGYDLPLVSAWLGHSTPEFTAKTYVIRSQNELRVSYFNPPTKTDS